MKENVPSYKDESTKVTDNQSIIEVNILFMFNAVSRHLNSVHNLHIRINRNDVYFFLA